MAERHLEAWDSGDPDLFCAMDETPLWSAPFGLSLLDTVVLKPGSRVLDVGCGLGFPALELAQRLGTSSHVIGLDPCRPALDRLGFKMTQYEVRNASAIQGKAETMPFEDASFDLIVSNNGLNNVADITGAWSECFRVSKPGAQMVITFNLPNTMIEFYEVYKQVLAQLGFENEIGFVDSHISEKRKPLDETRRLILDTGFAIESTREQSFTLRYLDGTAMLNHFLIRLAFAGGFKSILDKEIRDSVFERVEARLNEVASSRGELRLTVPFACIDCRRG